MNDPGRGSIKEMTFQEGMGQRAHDDQVGACLFGVPGNGFVKRSYRDGEAPCCQRYARSAEFLGHRLEELVASLVAFFQARIDEMKQGELRLVLFRQLEGVGGGAGTFFVFKAPRSAQADRY